MQAREKHVAIVLAVLIFLWTVLWLTEFDARWLGIRVDGGLLGVPRQNGDGPAAHPAP
jgi:hypothetical protein